MFECQKTKWCPFFRDYFLIHFIILIGSSTPCLLNPCQHNGSCLESGKCTCLPNFSGMFCEEGKKYGSCWQNGRYVKFTSLNSSLFLLALSQTISWGAKHIFINIKIKIRECFGKECIYIRVWCASHLWYIQEYEFALL